MAAAGLLAYGVFTRMKPTAAESPLGGAGFGNVALELPAGCAFKSVAVSGETVVIHAQRADDRNAVSPACDRIFVVHAASGRVLGTIDIRSARENPPPGPPRP